MLELLEFVFVFTMISVSCSSFLEVALFLPETVQKFFCSVPARVRSVGELGARFFDDVVMPVMTFPRSLVQLEFSSGLTFTIFVLTLVCVVVLVHRELYFSPASSSLSIDSDYLHANDIVPSSLDEVPLDPGPPVSYFPLICWAPAAVSVESFVEDRFQWLPTRTERLSDRMVVNNNIMWNINTYSTFMPSLRNVTLKFVWLIHGCLAHEYVVETQTAYERAVHLGEATVWSGIRPIGAESRAIETEKSVTSFRYYTKGFAVPNGFESDFGWFSWKKESKEVVVRRYEASPKIREVAIPTLEIESPSPALVSSEAQPEVETVSNAQPSADLTFDLTFTTPALAHVNQAIIPSSSSLEVNLSTATSEDLSDAHYDSPVPVDATAGESESESESRPSAPPKSTSPSSVFEEQLEVDFNDSGSDKVAPALFPSTPAPSDLLQVLHQYPSGPLVIYHDQVVQSTQSSLRTLQYELRVRDEGSPVGWKLELTVTESHTQHLGNGSLETLFEKRSKDVSDEPAFYERYCAIPSLGHIGKAEQYAELESLFGSMVVHYSHRMRTDCAVLPTPSATPDATTSTVSVSVSTSDLASSGPTDSALEPAATSSVDESFEFTVDDSSASSHGPVTPPNEIQSIPDVVNVEHSSPPLTLEDLVLSAPHSSAPAVESEALAPVASQPSVVKLSNEPPTFAALPHNLSEEYRAWYFDFERLYSVRRPKCRVPFVVAESESEPPFPRNGYVLAQNKYLRRVQLEQCRVASLRKQLGVHREARREGERPRRFCPLYGEKRRGSASGQNYGAIRRFLGQPIAMELD